MKGEKVKKEASEKSYWLYLHPYIHTSVKKDKILLYNTLNGKLLEYENNTPAARLIKRLDSDANLYVIKLNEDEIDTLVQQFIDSIRQFYIGDIIDTSLRPVKPIQLKPMLNLQKTLDYMTTARLNSKILVNDEVKDYLNVITLYINNCCDQSCPMCRTAYKQFPCCFKNDKVRDEVCIKEINGLMNEIKGSNLYKFNIIGGNIFLHSTLIELVKELNRFPGIKEYFSHYLNVEDKPEYFRLLSEGEGEGEGENYLNTIIHFPAENDALHRCMDVLNRWDIGKRFHFVIEKAEDISEAEEIISTFEIKGVEWVPYYNGTNLDFFKENVFLNRKAIIESKPSMNDIFARITLNTTDFKKLTILSNKEIYANLNHPEIGQWGKDCIFDVIFKELHYGKSWTKVRKNVKPCKSCVFNALCPPISNYEYAIKRYNLCDIW